MCYNITTYYNIKENIVEALSVLFIVGSMWFWLSAAVLFFVILALSENDHNIMAGAALVGFLAVINFFNPLLISFTFASIILWSVIYFIIGGGWSFIKWFSFLREKADRFEKLKLEWIAEFKEQNPDNILKLTVETNIREVLGKKAAFNFREILTKRNYLLYPDNKILPDSSNNKEKIVTWILYWPTSVFWTILNDPMVRLANWIYNKFGNVYAAIANSVFKNVGVGEDV